MNRALFGSSDEYKRHLLLQMMREDFDNGLVLVDPDGALAELAANTVPAEMTERVVYLDPADYAYPRGFNILAELATAEEKDRLTADVCAVYDAIYPAADGTITRAMSGLLLRNCVRVLLDTPGATILGVTRMLGDAEYRRRCVANCRNPVVLKSWEVIEGWDGKQYAAYAAFLQTNMDDLLLSATMQNIFGQARTTFRLDRGMIVIANLNRAAVGDRDAFMLGSFLLARAEAPVYIGDLGFFRSDHLAGLFSRGGYTAAVRFLDDLAPGLRRAVMDPATDKYVFQTARKDAEELAYYVGVDNPQTLMAPILHADEYRHAAGTAVPPHPALGSRLPAIKRRSRSRHARYRKPVEAAIRDFLQP
jgi:hypothetical protein